MGSEAEDFFDRHLKKLLVAPTSFVSYEQGPFSAAAGQQQFQQLGGGFWAGSEVSTNDGLSAEVQQAVTSGQAPSDGSGSFEQESARQAGTGAQGLAALPVEAMSPSPQAGGAA